jgi:hypothetical protein
MTPQAATEEDFPKGHPARFDYDPASPEAKEWARKNIHPKGERDFPVDHPKAVDTKGNTNHVPIRPGVDPLNPTREAFTGASPEVAAARKVMQAALAKQQAETPMLPEGFVDVGAIAKKTAIDFLLTQGHDEETAEKILAEQGTDQILAAKATLSAGE